MTMTQRILARKAGVPSVKADELIVIDLDLVMANDVTGPPAIKVFSKLAQKVFNKDKVALIPSHFTPNKDIAAAENAKFMRSFAREQDLSHYYELGDPGFGIEHVILPENGLVLPGDALIGADSHTCTNGALGAFATGVGSTDLGAAMATGKAWIRVPQAINFQVTGSLQENVSGKDLILYIISLIGVNGGLYKSLEFSGPGLSFLTMADRLTIANMAVEAGAKNAVFPTDQILLDYIAKRNPERFAQGDYASVEYNEEAEYSEVYQINLDELPSYVAYPHLPSNAKTLAEAEKDQIKVDQVLIGSCTNGRIEDLRVAAKYLAGQKIAPNTRCIIIPGSQKVYRQAVAEGLLDIFLDAGAVFTMPTCGPCLGGHMGVLAAGETCVSTTNRNFVGRMGHQESKVYLASPAVAAASAIAGVLVGPNAVEE